MTKYLLVILFFSVGLLQAQDLYDINSIMEIRVTFEEKDWDVKLDSLKQEGNDDRLKGQVVVNGEKYEKVGVRYKGNSSYFNVRNTNSRKLPFNIKINYKKKKQKLPGGYTTLKLSNIFRDPSFLREVLSYEIAGNYMPAPQANFAKVYVNDEYIGLYNATESVDDRFLEQYFGNSSGTLLKCDPNWHAETPVSCPEGDKASLMYLGQDSLCYMGLYELKSKYGWSDLIHLTQVLNEQPEKLEDILNVDQTLWMLAFNSVLVNLDSYTGRLCHNYYIYKDTMGIYHPVLWDMNLSLGGFRYTGLGRPLTNEAMQTLSPFVHYKEKNPKRPLITNLLGNNHYRRIYVAHIRTIVNDYFANGKYMERAKEIVSLIEPEVEADSNKLYPFEEFKKNITGSAKAGKSNIIGLEELMGPRTEYLQTHRLISKAAPTINEVKHTDFGDILAFNAVVEGAQSVWLYYRVGKEGNFKRVEMFDDSGHSDELENDNIWGVTLDSQNGIQYYIVAENESTAALSPERASMEFHEVNIN